MMKHIAIIMDGNRRFAKKHNKLSSFGHESGAEVIKSVCALAKKIDLQFLTLFAFSSENWNRKKEEIDLLNKLLEKFLTKEIGHFIKNQIKVNVIGDRSPYSHSIQEKIIKLEESTKEFSSFTLSIMLNYGGREEILNAVNASLDKGKENVSKEEFEDSLCTKNLPDVDLLIRTGGARRLSNFILWKLAYAELYFTDVLWPEFSDAEFEKALTFFHAQVRNFGA